MLLGFVTNNSYTITANTNISGTYKVVTTYEKYKNNQSDAATFKFEYTPKETEEPDNNETDENNTEQQTTP